MWQNHPEAHKHLFFFFGWGDRLVDVHAAPPSRGGYQSAGRRAGFFSCETELPPRLAVELVTRLEMLIVRHTRCHLGQRAALDSPRRCLRVIRPVGWRTAAALLLWQWLVYPSKAIAAPVMPPTWHGGLASAPGTLPRQSAQRRETGGAQQESFFFFFIILATESEKHNGSFISFFLPLGLRGLSRSRTAAMLWGTSARCTRLLMLICWIKGRSCFYIPLARW